MALPLHLPPAQLLHGQGRLRPASAAVASRLGSMCCDMQADSAVRLRWPRQSSLPIWNGKPTGKHLSQGVLGFPYAMVAV